jgi:hypothetical protein
MGSQSLQHVPELASKNCGSRGPPAANKLIIAACCEQDEQDEQERNLMLVLTEPIMLAIRPHFFCFSTHTHTLSLPPSDFVSWPQHFL